MGNTDYGKIEVEKNSPVEDNKGGIPVRGATVGPLLKHVLESNRERIEKKRGEVGSWVNHQEKLRGHHALGGREKQKQGVSGK